MIKENIIKVSNYLNEIGIKHENTENSILVDRDSICKWANLGEQESYNELRRTLCDKFNSTFIYTFKTDEWLMLEKIA